MSWRRGLVMGGGGCGTLGQPYVLWDTRVWRADAMGQGLRAMPNLGIGGPQWDLDVYNVGSPGSYTTIASQNNDEWLGSPRIPWSAVGGLPCDGRPFTVLMAYGDFPLNNSYAEGDMLFANGKYVSQFGLTQCLGAMNNVVDDTADRFTFAAVFHGYGFGAYNQWNLPTDAETAPGSGTEFLRNRLIAVTMDSINGECNKCFNNTREIPEQPDGPGQEEFFIATTAGACADHAGETYIGTHHFFYCGEHRNSPATGATPGQPFDGMVGTALFRGVPSASSMQFWYDYFYGPAPDPLPPYVSPFPYSGGFSKWTDGTYAYHEFSGTAGGASLTPVSGYTLPSTIDFWLIGGGGGGCGFQTPGGGGGGGGGEVIEVLGIAAPVTSQTFVQGAGGASRTNGGSSTFMGYTARGGRGATSHVGGTNGDLVTPGGTRLLAERAGGGGGGAGGPGQNAAGTTAGKGGLGREIVTIGGSTIPWAAGGHAGGNTGTIITPQSQWVEPGGLAATTSPIQVALRGGGGGGRVSNTNATGFPGAVGGLVVRYLLP